LKTAETNTSRARGKEQSAVANQILVRKNKLKITLVKCRMMRRIRLVEVF
jgi:hypothetical protein